MPIQLDWDVWTGWPSRVEGSFHRRIGGYTRNGRPFKIGITGDPEQRSAVYDETYDRMIVLYETKSEKNARNFERRLIDFYREHCDNERRGGGGRLGGPPFYLYVVTNWRPAARTGEPRRARGLCE